MPAEREPGPFPLEGVDFETWLVRFDKHGACTSPRTSQALLNRLQQKSDSPVLVFSHGWNNDFSDATALYKSFLSSFRAVIRQYPLDTPDPIFVGIIWPSTWFPDDRGPHMADTGISFRPFLSERFVTEIGDTLGSDALRKDFYNFSEASSLAESDIRKLAQILAPNLHIETEGVPEASASEDEIFRAQAELQSLFSAKTEPADKLDYIGTVAGARDSTRELSAAGQNAFDPRWLLRLASLYLMKDRAGTVGANGVSQLISQISAASAGRTHLVGHSFGAKVMLSALARMTVEGPSVQSLLLLQPAISHLCFAKSVPGRQGEGGYRNAMHHVEKPIFCTFSAHDFPLHEIYHHALLRRDDLGELRIAASAMPAGEPPSIYAALGGYGPRGSGEFLVGQIPAPGERITLGNARLIGLDGTDGNRIDSHGGVSNPYTAWALRSLMSPM